MKNKRVAVLTSGGDSPGMNATIYGFVAQALSLGMEPYVVMEGYKGLIENAIRPITLEEAFNFKNEAGSFIGSARCPEFQNELVARQKCVTNLQNLGIDSLFVIGGEGSYKGAEKLMELGVKVVTAPGTIDNDVASSTFTIGFYSALEEIYRSYLKVKMTADTHRSIMIIEAMGRRCIDLTYFGGVISGVDSIVTNQNIFQLEDFLRVIETSNTKNTRGVVFLVSEMTYGPKGGYNLPTLDEIAKTIEAKIKRAVRVMTLSYLQRGAPPTAFEILNAILFGEKAADLMFANELDLAIGINGKDIYLTPLLEANRMSPDNRKKEIEHHNTFLNLR